MRKPKSVTIKTGSAEEFLRKVKSVMRAADKKEPIEPSYTLVFEDPAEMLHFFKQGQNQVDW